MVIGYMNIGRDLATIYILTFFFFKKIARYTNFNDNSCKYFSVISIYNYKIFIHYIILYIYHKYIDIY